MSLVVLVGYFLTDWHGQAILDGDLVQWQSVGYVPESPRRIIWIVDDGLFPILIEGASGKFYRCCEDFGTAIRHYG